VLRVLAIALASAFAIACTPPTERSNFQHAINDAKRPWTNEAFDAAADKFTFAVFSDLTGGER